VNATLMVRTYNGSFKSTFPVKQDDQAPRKRFTLTLGNGSAHLELESFGGTIALRRPGEPRPEVEREKRRQRDQAHGPVNLDAAIAAAQASIPKAIAAAEASIPEAIAAAEASIPDAIAEAMASLDAMPDPMPFPTPFVMPFAMPMPTPHITPRPAPRPTPRLWR